MKKEKEHQEELMKLFEVFVEQKGIERTKFHQISHIFAYLVQLNRKK